MMSTLRRDKSTFAILTILCFGVNKAVNAVTYTAYHSYQTWYVSKQHCENIPRNSVLARIQDLNDVQNARKRFPQYQNPPEYWVGIKYVVNQKDFIWADGSALPSNNDFENIVNRSLLQTRFSDQCMYITADEDVLLPSDCNVPRKYICQCGQDDVIDGVSSTLVMITKPSSKLQPSTSSTLVTLLSLPISSQFRAQQPLLSASPTTLVPPMTLTLLLKASPSSTPLTTNSLSELSSTPRINTITLSKHSSVFGAAQLKIIATPSRSSLSSPTVVDFERLIQDHENKLSELNVSDPSSLERAMNLTSQLLKDANEVDTNGTTANLLVSGRELEEFALRYAKYHMTSKNDSKTIVSIGLDEIAMSVMRIPADNRNDVLFPRVTAAFDHQTFILEEEKAMKLPAELFTGQERYAACILYNNATKMIPNEATNEVERRITRKSRIVACTLSPTLTGILTENVTIKLRKLQKEEGDVTSNCVYWDFSHRIKDGGSWSMDGCSLVHSSKEHTSCSCNHLTNFAVLMEVRKTEISDKNKLALEIITYIGCALSLAGESVTILAYLILMNLTSVQTQIRLNMVICLAIAQLVFIAGIEGATRNEVLCISVATMINYFYLVAFAWMVMEGIMLYLMLVKVFNVNAKMNYFYGFSWGFPALVVVIALSANVILTGGMESAMRQDVCWFSFSSGFVWSFVGPVLLACLTNLIILVRIVVEMMKLNDASCSSDGCLLRHSLKACLVLCPLLGLSWIFGVFVATEPGLIFQYLFAILNSLQGFFIFIFHVARSKELKAALLSKKHKWNASRSISISHEKRLGAIGLACSGKGNDLFSPRNRITPNPAIDQSNLPRIV